MLDYEYLLLRCVKIVINGESIDSIHKDLYKQLDQIHKNLILEIFCLILDEIIVERFLEEFDSNKSKIVLLEDFYFKTSYGGNHFFIKLKQFILDKDYEMLRICYLGLKLGFKGQYPKVPEKIFDEIQNILNIQDTNVSQSIIFKPKKEQAKPYSIFFGISPIFFILIGTTLTNYFLFRSIIPSVKVLINRGIR